MRGKETFWKKFSFPRAPILQKLSNEGYIYNFTLCVDLIFGMSSWASNFIASRTRSATRSVGISNKILLSPRRSCASHTPSGFDSVPPVILSVVELLEQRSKSARQSRVGSWRDFAQDDTREYGRTHDVNQKLYFQESFLRSFFSKKRHKNPNIN